MACMDCLGSFAAAAEALQHLGTYSVGTGCLQPMYLALCIALLRSRVSPPPCRNVHMCMAVG